MGTITHWHSHIYFDESSLDQAKELSEKIDEKFDIDVGTFWKKNVGPHPRWSVQLKYDRSKFGRVMPYLMKHRNGLTIFTHPVTGEDLKDHTDHAIWMGEMLDLKLDIFEP